MTPTPQTPAVGQPLDAESVRLLVKGDVLRIDTGGELHSFIRAKGGISRLICTKRVGGSVERFYDRCRFTFVERPHAPSSAHPEPASQGREGGDVASSARVLLDACVADFGDPSDFDGDDGSVASGEKGWDSAVTFKMMRDLQAALTAGAEPRATDVDFCSCPKPTPRDTEDQCAACYNPIAPDADKPEGEAVAWRYRTAPHRQWFLTESAMNAGYEAADGSEVQPLYTHPPKPDARLSERLDRLTQGAARQNEEICQVLGKALGYPWFKDDQKNFPGATEADGVCVGEHVAESLADEAARRIREIDARLSVAMEAAKYAVSLLPGLAGAANKPDNTVYTVMANKGEILEARSRLATALRQIGSTEKGEGDVRQAIVKTIAFLKRDLDTPRINDTVESLLPDLVRADAILRGGA